MKVAISRALLDQILAHAAGLPDEEVCGLLFGEHRRIVSAQPAANIAPHRGRSFELDPGALLAAHRAARTGGPAIIGHYHSHPSGDLLPSPRDSASATPGMLWLIVHGREAALYEVADDGPIHGNFRVVEFERH